MPTLSMFYGIIIIMHREDSSRHHTPHFHAQYGSWNASFDLNGNVLAGEFPPKQMKLVVAWVEIHRDELSANWDLLSCGQKPYKIKPLR